MCICGTEKNKSLKIIFITSNLYEIQILNISYLCLGHMAAKNTPN